MLDFPGGRGDMDSFPVLGRFHMEQLSAYAATTEPMLDSQKATATEARMPRTCAQQGEGPPKWEAHTQQWWGALLATTGESLPTATKTECSPERKLLQTRSRTNTQQY